MELLAKLAPWFVSAAIVSGVYLFFGAFPALAIAGLLWLLAITMIVQDHGLTS
jgi:hypothetical protein